MATQAIGPRLSAVNGFCIVLQIGTRLCGLCARHGGTAAWLAKTAALGVDYGNAGDWSAIVCGERVLHSVADRNASLWTLRAPWRTCCVASENGSPRLRLWQRRRLVRDCLR